MNINQLFETYTAARAVQATRYSLYSKMQYRLYFVRNIKKEEVVLARLRSGHARVTHSYLLQGEEQPQCVGCDAPFTVRHFLLECGDFARVRNNCFNVDNMKQLF